MGCFKKQMLWVSIWFARDERASCSRGEEEGCVLVTRDVELKTTARRIGVRVALPEELI